MVKRESRLTKNYLRLTIHDLLISQNARFVNVERFAIAENRNYNAESDGGFGCGDAHYDENKHLPGRVVKEARKRYKRQIDGVEHQLDAHKHSDGVAFINHAECADGEQNARKR